MFLNQKHKEFFMLLKLMSFDQLSESYDFSLMGTTFWFNGSAIQVFYKKSIVSINVARRGNKTKVYDLRYKTTEFKHMIFDKIIKELNNE